MASINIVLKAIDQYSGVITGLNQGFDLVGKTIGSVVAIGNAAWAALSAGAKTVAGVFESVVGLAEIGGAFDEQRNQFENLAASYGKSGQKIIDKVKEISSNTITELQSIPVATKAVASRLQGPDLENVLSYAKKWSEAYGGSYESAAEAIFDAFSTGKFAVLKQMGLVIEKGTSLDGVLKLVSSGLKHFGDTGFNTADKIQALSASQDDFWRKVGQGINQSTQFQGFLGDFSDGIVEFVKKFDARPVTYFADTVAVAIKNIMSGALERLPDSWRVWETVFNSSKDGAKNWSISLIDIFFTVVKSVASTVNNVLDIISNAGLIKLLSGIATGAITIIRGVLVSIPEAIASVIELNIRTVSEYYGRLVSMVENSSILSRVIGKDEISQAKGLIDWLDNTASSVGKSADALGSIDKIFSAATDSINGVGAALTTSRVDLDSLTESHAKFRTDVYRGLDKSIETTYRKAETALKAAGSSYAGVIDLAKGQGENGPSVDQIRADSGIDDLESDLDELLKKASEPVSKQTGLENAVNSATKPKSATDQLTSGLNLEAVKMALGDMILQYITGIASSERTPMAVLAT